MTQEVESSHNLVRASVAYPIFCIVCEDYIVTAQCTARKCITCGCLFHAACVFIAEKCQGSSCNLLGDNEAIVCNPETSTAVALSDQPLTNWSVQQVLQWLVVVGLSRYTDLFFACNINGQALPGLLKPISPLNNIKDPFVRRGLKRAIMTLVGELPSSTNWKFSASQDSLATPHTDLRIKDFTCELACCVCSLPLLGLSSQGYQCSACGSVFHRICRIFTGAHPTCTGRVLVDTLPSSQNANSSPPDPDLHQRPSKLPTAAPVIKHTYFTVALDKQITDADDVPIFLSTATRIFEQLATYNAQTTTRQRLPQQLLPSSSSSTVPPLSMINCLDVYRVSASGRELYDMEYAYADRLPTDLESNTSIPTEQRLIRLAQIIKRFLRQLPEPVIPAEMYQRTLDLAPGGDNGKISASSSAGDSSDLEDFLSSLPPRNLATLRHLMQHVGFLLCHQRLLKVRLSVGQHRQPYSPIGSATSSANVDRLDDPRLILSILAYTFIRPTWNRVVLLASSDGSIRRLMALERLFDHLNRTPGSGSVIGGGIHSRSARPVKSYEFYAELLALSGGGSIISTERPAEPSQCGPPTAQSAERNRRDLVTRDWYWGDVSRAEVSEIMRGQPDGAFMLRDSTSATFATASAFTLTERRNCNIILFRIYHRGDVFDITNPPSPGFPLVSSLIAHYQQQGPFVNIKVPIPRLLFPVVRSNLLKLSRNLVSVSWDQIVKCLLSALRSTSMELSQLEANVDDLDHRSSEMMSQMAVTTNQLRALERAHGWLAKTKSQLSRCKKATKGDSHEVLEKYTNLLTQRLIWANAGSRIKYQEHNNILDRIRDVSESLVVLCSQKYYVSQRMQEIRRELKRCGVSDEVIFACDLGSADSTASAPMAVPMEGTESSVESSSTSLTLPLAPMKRSMWFAEVTRQEAEELLSDKPSGTFLIRPSAMADLLALTVKAGVSVQHCLIYSGDNDEGALRWGFSLKALIFSSLEELVAYYRVNSLVQHNALLDTTLKLPAFASASTLISQNTTESGTLMSTSTASPLLWSQTHQFQQSSGLSDLKRSPDGFSDIYLSP